MEEYISRIYEEALKRGYSGSKKEFIETEIKRSVVSEIPQLEDTLDTHFVTQAVTFGTDEPSYCELIGSEEVLRLRAVGEAKFLLLGSLGSYSAREFKNFAQKISQKIEPFVVDIDPVSVEKIKREWGNTENVMETDARNLPFGEEIFDYVFTNRLFHDLVRRSGHQRDIEIVFQEVSRVLKRGGSFVIAEDLYGNFAKKRDSTRMKRELISLAGKNSLKVLKTLDDLIEFPFTKERSSAKFDNDGKPNYGEAFLLKNFPGFTFGARFVKS
ncbi:MAG: class I SAM-dependent methyltransferase [Candidatus Pacebacteria bacterium]|nr:class I SAM-dependent methyltransferase [Candidatus Paceibacterota bacterium]MDD5356645.1 class I SAM-dependent methyltransferase [Candidatus Paceibacterota bacterium]